MGFGLSGAEAYAVHVAPTHPVLSYWLVPYWKSQMPVVLGSQESGVRVSGFAGLCSTCYFSEPVRIGSFLGTSDSAVYDRYLGSTAR